MCGEPILPYSSKSYTYVTYTYVTFRFFATNMRLKFETRTLNNAEGTAHK